MITTCVEIQSHQSTAQKVGLSRPAESLIGSMQIRLKVHSCHTFQSLQTVKTSILKNFILFYRFKSWRTFLRAIENCRLLLSQTCLTGASNCGFTFSWTIAYDRLSVVWYVVRPVARHIVVRAE